MRRTLRRKGTTAEREDALPINSWAANLAVRAIRAGCADFAIKPVSRQKFETLIETFLPSRPVPIITLPLQPTAALSAGGVMIRAKQIFQPQYRRC